MNPLKRLRPTPSELTARLVGDSLISSPDVVMDRGFTIDAVPDVVWPWIAQLGKNRAGWYFPRSVERVIPRSHRAFRTILPEWQVLQVGQRIPDYGGRDATLEVAILHAPHTVVYRSSRRGMNFTWAIYLTELSRSQTRLHLRLALGPVKRKWSARSFGEFFDLLTIAGLAAGLTERINGSKHGASST